MRATTSGTLGSLVLAILLVFCIFLIARESFAVESEVVPNDGKVEVIYPAQSSRAYRDRRSSWSTMFAINVDQILPDSFRSQVNNDSYTTMFGKTPIKMLQAEIGTKYNFPLGSLGVNLMVGTGTVDDLHGTTGPGDSLDILKKGASLSFIMDNLFKEPYVAPYIQGQMYSFEWKESRNDGSERAGSTSLGMALSFGFLIQLNWLDPESSTVALDSLGLNNTYLDLFVSQYNTSNGESDPDFQTSMNYGAGLRFEF